MTTTTKVHTRREFRFTSEGVDQIEAALELFFGDKQVKMGCLRMTESNRGLHLSRDDSAQLMIPLLPWGQVDLVEGSRYEKVAQRVDAWLRNLTLQEKRKLNTRSPHMPVFSTIPAHRFNGFTITSDHDVTGEHEMLTIIPDWV